MVWHEAQSVAPWAAWLKVAPDQLLVLWHCEHCPEKWLAGLSLVWHELQFVAPWAAWLNDAPDQVVVLWHCAHWPEK